MLSNLVAVMSWCYAVVDRVLRARQVRLTLRVFGRIKPMLTLPTYD